MSAESRLAPAARVGPYEVVSLLGHGGMGEVYRARDLRLSRDVALKVLHGELAKDEDRTRRFEQEARAAGILNHPNIVAVYDIGQHEGWPYIISELLQGETLRDRMATSTLGWRKAVEYGIQIAHGLTAAHERGIVHRDLKPENLFLTKDGLIKILDFGIAKLGPGEGGVGSDIETLSQTGPGTILGTAGYMSPEQVRGLVADHRSDVFSLGAVLFEMLTGNRAFKGTSPAGTLSAILREDPTDGLEAGLDLAPGLLRVVRRCLEKAPEDRFQTARDLAFALEGETAVLASPNRTPERGPVERSLGRWLLPALAALGVLGTAFGLWWGRRGAPLPTPLSFERLTARLGGVQSARFAPDGETILYSARWGTDPIEVFSTRAATRGWRPLGLTDALVLAISSREELALLLRPRSTTFGVFEGTLARAPMAGGTPREVLEGVLDADWSRDGKELAVIHIVGDRYRVEYPIGHVLYDPDPPVWLSGLRIFPRTDQAALIEHTVAADTRGSVVVASLDGQRRTLASGFSAIGDVNWSPDGDEIWFSATRKGGGAATDARRVAVGPGAGARGNARALPDVRCVKARPGAGSEGQRLGGDPSPRPRRFRGSGSGGGRAVLHLRPLRRRDAGARNGRGPGRRRLRLLRPEDGRLAPRMAGRR